MRLFLRHVQALVFRIVPIRVVNGGDLCGCKLNCKYAIFWGDPACLVQEMTLGAKQ